MDFINLVLVLFALLICVAALRQFWQRNPLRAVVTMTIGIVAFLGIRDILSSFMKLGFNTGESLMGVEPSSAPSASPTPTPESIPASESPSVEETPITIDTSWAIDIIPALGAILLMMIILGLGAFLISIAVKRNRISKRIKSDIRNKWVEARKINDDADKILASYELDIFKAVSYPSMNDSRVPATYEMIKKRKVVESIKSTMSNDTIGGGDDLFNRYFNAVNEYHAAVLRAEEQAKLRGIDNYTPEEYRLFEKLKGLISQTSDSLTTDALKQSYYSQIEKTARKLNSIAGVEMIKTAPMRQLAQNIGVKLLESSGQASLV